MANTSPPARWYMLDKDGMATLCTDKADAEREAADAQAAWPHTGPHRAVQLIEADGRASHGQASAQAAVRHLEAVIKGAADKLDAAVCCHPNAVDALIHEALEILDGDRRPDWTPVTKAGA